jgi:gluconokinase
VTGASANITSDAPIIVVTGVSGAGKTTVGEMLASRLGCPMLEGDDLHSEENVRLMADGVALTDADRQDWLSHIAARILEAINGNRPLVVTCSALKRKYRDVLRGSGDRVTFVYLKAKRALIVERLASRHNHFMPVSLVDSQFEALEEPSPEEHAIACSIDRPTEDIVAEIVGALAAQCLIAKETRLGEDR